MSEPIKSALTPDEWTEFLDPANKEWAPLMYHNLGAHAAAATNLYGQPFGFTRHDVYWLRTRAHLSDGSVDAEMLGIADRIEALLPPEGMQ